MKLETWTAYIYIYVCVYIYRYRGKKGIKKKKKKKKNEGTIMKNHVEKNMQNGMDTGLLRNLNPQPHEPEKHQPFSGHLAKFVLV